MSTPPPPPGPFPPEQPVESPFGSRASQPQPFPQMSASPPAYGQQPYQQVPAGYQPTPPGYQPFGYGAARTSAGPNAFAITSLVLGIVGVPFFCLYAIPSILAVIFGAISLNQFKSQPNMYTGRGMAIAGLVLGLAGIALLILLFAAGARWFAMG